MTELTLPHKFTPRPYQHRLLKAMDYGYKRAVAIWHRRAGKDLTLVNLLTKKAFERVGIHYYLFPTAAWGRRILWHGMDRNGIRFLDRIPEELRTKTREDEMRIELANGSSIQIVGTDNLNVVGPNPIGCVFSEYSLQNPRAWDLIRPILAENDGWAVFNYTPRGRNHGFDLYQMALDNPKWFTQLLTVEDTGAIPMAAIDEERRAGMSEELIQQEFYCSFDYGLEGAYYLNQINRARSEGRITNIPIEDLPVYTAWDLGIGDSTAIWFFQLVRQEVRIIDYHEDSGEGLAHYAKVLQDRGYLYGDHYAPHDVEHRELGSGTSLRQRGRELGIKFKVVPKHTIEDGIEAARSIFPRCWFDKDRAKAGLNALMNYRKEWDDKHQVFRTRPLHDWASHGADSFRYLAVAVRRMSTNNSMTESEARRLYEQYAPPVA
jgi:hypothetical protein